jgi:hypothetical protein
LPDALKKKSPGDHFSRGSWRVEGSPPRTTLLATSVPQRVRYALTEPVPLSTLTLVEQRESTAPSRRCSALRTAIG